MIDRYVHEIKSCLEGGCYFAALALTLTLPDVCGNAEYPNGRVGERYIAWFDANVGAALRARRGYEETPYLSGEIVYNLRNQFLHQGDVRLATSKIREEGNRVDRFTLLLGDGTRLWNFGLTLNASDAWYRFIVIDVTWLCELICDAAALYYAGNRDKFRMTVDAIEQERLFGGEGDAGAKRGDPLGDAINQKLRSGGEDIQIVGNVTDGLMDAVSRAFKAMAEVDPTEQEGGVAEWRVNLPAGPRDALPTDVPEDSKARTVIAAQVRPIF